MSNEKQKTVEDSVGADCCVCGNSIHDHHADRRCADAEIIVLLRALDDRLHDVCRALEGIHDALPYAGRPR